jgi:MYXO-CTERM domain-containing protein
MRFHRGLPLLAFTLTALAGQGLLQAATANCVNRFGTCDVSNNGFDWTECMCADGSGGGGGGGNMWAGLSDMELVPICEEQLDMFCGPFIPPDWTECWGAFGFCILENDPEDSLFCECYDGSVTGVAGGNAWAGYDDAMLLAECEVQLDMSCMPPAAGIACSNANGECTIANVPSDFLACECGSGDGGVMSGGNAWAGYSELDLHTECGTQLVSFCGGPLPPLPWVECSSKLGACMIDNDPADVLECTCADGQRISGGGGNEWAGLSNDELFTECEEQLYQGCAAGADSGTDTGDTTTTDSGSSSGDSGPDTGIDGSGDSSSTGTPPPPPTTSDDATGDSSGGDGGATGDGGGCSCTTSRPPSTGEWLLALLGVVGVGWRRRRARVRRS